MRMGLTPRDLDGVSFAEWRCMIDGWNSVQAGPSKPAAPSPDDHAERLARLKDR